MKRYYELINLRGLLTAMGSLFLLASCSSYQYAGYENDGIYSSSRSGEAYTANDYEESYENALYYRNLFGEKAEQLAAVPEEGAIFTDVESYSSGQYGNEMFGEEGIAYEPGRAAWGTDPDVISINIYNDYNPLFYGYGYHFPRYSGFYDPFWGPHYRYGFYNPYSYRFGYGYGYGYPYAYRSWGWNVGWNYGWGGYYNQHRYSPYYSNPYFPSQNRRDVAYSSSRRNSYSADTRYRQSNNEGRASRIQSYSNTRNVRAAGTTRTDARTYQTRSTRVRASVPERRSSSTYRTSTQRREVQSTRTAPTRSSSEVRTSRSSGNNSTYRSSSTGSSSRSSGTSSSRSRGGRGN